MLKHKTELPKTICTNLKRHQTDFINANNWQNHANFDAHIMYDVFVTQFMSFLWLIVPLEQQMGGIDKALAIFNFCPANTTIKAWADFTNTQQIAADDEKYKTDVQKRKKKSHTLYTKGHMTEVPHLLSTISNYLLFVGYALADATKSALHKILKAYLLYLTSHTGRTWLKHALHKQKWVVHSLLTEIHSVISHLRLGVLKCAPPPWRTLKSRKS